MTGDRIPHRMSTAETKALIEAAVLKFQQEVPALQKLRLVIELELRGRGDIQLFRVEVPGPKVTRDIASDAKVRLSLPRSHFNELAEDGKLRNWREAFEAGFVTATENFEGCSRTTGLSISEMRLISLIHWSGLSTAAILRAAFELAP